MIMAVVTKQGWALRSCLLRTRCTVRSVTTMWSLFEY